MIFGRGNVFKTLGDVPTVLGQFQRVLDDSEEATGDVGTNDPSKKTIMMQLLPTSLRVAGCDTPMAARQTFVGVSPDYLSTIIVQRCEFDEAAMGNAVPMDAGGIDAHEDTGSLGQRGVGPRKEIIYKQKQSMTIKEPPPQLALFICHRVLLFVCDVLSLSVALFFPPSYARLPMF